eukprot:TRINITY_DN2064_c0_g1_i2.p1 TRINITY_DN2064_c0_g1~~TRINITY_DN2064_c0_g1_i2.p1  ORF type:complete len:140 (-),score=10.56 TRINITY_DN2064_c0_g1_i2:50-469(-)
MLGRGIHYFDILVLKTPNCGTLHVGFSLGLNLVNFDSYLGSLDTCFSIYDGNNFYHDGHSSNTKENIGRYWEANDVIRLILKRDHESSCFKVTVNNVDYGPCPSSWKMPGTDKKLFFAVTLRNCKIKVDYRFSGDLDNY